MILYGWATIPFMYPLNFLFQLPSTAFVVASSMNVFIGVITTMTTTVIDSLAADEPELARINNILKPIFTMFFPHYCLGQGFIIMTLLYNTAATNAILGRSSSYNPFLFKNVGQNLIAMAVQGVVFFVFNLLIQYKFFIRIKPTQNVSSLNLPLSKNEDSDVLEEKNRMLSKNDLTKSSKFGFGRKFNFLKNRIRSAENSPKSLDITADEDSNKDYIKLINLTKVFTKFKKLKLKKHTAVNNLSLGINKGECFGLIGVNGAGKKFLIF
jgi:ATP-binding cassette subfamily A (ABC1) protein 1